MAAPPSEVMYTSPPSSSRGGIQEHGQFQHAATANAWDSDNVFYVGMEYPNMGACSQKEPALFHPGNDPGGCSQNKTNVSVSMTSAETVGGYGIAGTNHGVGTSANTSGIFAPMLPHPPRSAVALPSAFQLSMPAAAPAFTTREGVVTSQPSIPCQVEGCDELTFNVGGKSPAALCEGHLRGGMLRTAHNDRIYGKTRSEGITRPTYDNKNIKHEAETKPDTESPLVKQEPVTGAPALMNQPEITPETRRDSKSVSGGSGVVDPSESKLCQHPGCDKNPRYGHEDAAPILCRSHKRAGMYTTRDGRVLLSTRDGKGVTKVVSRRAEAPSRAAAERMLDVEGESTDEDPTWSPSSLNSSLQTMNRKLCEVPGCQVQPSYGPSGSTRPRFCSEHKGKGHVGLKNRPCLFPGCLTRPHYGLTTGRAVYCATHKKDGMVHLLKESILLEREIAARNREESRKKVAERKKRQAAAAAGMMNNDEEDGGNDYDDDDEQWTEESEFGRRGGRVSSKSKSRSEARGSGRRGTFRKNKGRWSKRTSPPSHVSSSGSPGWSPSQDTKDKASADSESDKHLCASASPLYSRLPDGEGVSSVMAPSVEIRLLQQARESARAAAEASGSGRRPRAPSRKLLEASGALDNEGAQWMTREIKEADAKVKQELREQRKHFKAAGLKAGEVIEAFTPAKAGGGDSTADTGIEGGDCGGSSGGGSGSGGSGGSSCSGLSNKQSWRVQTQAPARKQQQQQQQQQRSAGEVSAASANISTKKEAVEAFSPAAVDELPLKRAWVVSVPDGPAREGGSAMAEGDATVPTPKRSKQGRDGHKREDGRGTVSEARGSVSAGKQKPTGGGGESKGFFADSGEARGGSLGQTKCEFGDCSKTASFGVNGTVRYCKIHRLFGMHEIPQSR